MLTASRLPSTLALALAPTRTADRGWHWLRRAPLILLLLGAMTVPRVRADEFNLRDLQHEVLARAALAGDAQLLPLNLIVRVQNRVATLSGPVPSRELARRALDTVKKVPEVREVRDNLTVQFEDLSPLLPLPTALPKSTPPVLATPGVVDAKKATAPAGVWMPVAPDPVKQATHGVLLPALDTLGGVAEPVSRPKAGVSTSPDAAAISSAVQSLVLSEERYRLLRYEVKLGEVFLSGVVNKWSDLQDLARALMHIPGVKRVVLRDVDTEASRK